MAKTTFKVAGETDKGKLRVGEHACDKNSISEFIRLPDTGFTMICNHLSNRPVVEQCMYDGECGFQVEVTDEDAAEYPDLFIKD